MSKSTVDHLVEQLSLSPHPEGGYYREVYRSSGTIPDTALPEDFSGHRNYATSIYYLLAGVDFSAFHRFHQDELWHFYEGTPLIIHIIDTEGNYETKTVGAVSSHGKWPQVMVPAGSWFASELEDKGSYALVGCTVAPGFDFEDFELASKEDLIRQFPDHREVIDRLTR